MANRIQLRRDTAAEWASINPVLAQGEPGVETDTGKAKYGDGATAWLALPYAAAGPQGPPGTADDVSMAGVAADAGSEFRGVLDGTYASKAYIKAEDYPTPQEAINAAGTGGTVVFTASHTLNGNVLTVPSRLTLRTAHRGITITQTVWPRPVFDLLGADDVVIEGFNLVALNGHQAPNSANPTAFRGEGHYGYAAGVWANGSRNLVRDCTMEGFTSGIMFSSWDGAALSAVRRVGNRGYNLKVKNVEFGVLFLSQEGLVIDGLDARDIVPADSSLGAVAPPHALYGSGTTSQRSRNVTFDNVQTVNAPEAPAILLKYTDGVTIGKMSAETSNGLLSSIDCTNVNIVEGHTTNPVTQGPTIYPTVDFQRNVPGTPTGMTDVTIGQLTIDAPTTTAANAKAAFSFNGDRLNIRQLTIRTNITDAASTTSPVIIDGTEAAVESVTLRATAFGSRAIMIGGRYGATNVTISGFRCNKAERIASVQASATGIHLAYNPAEVRSIPAGASPVVPINGTSVGYKVTRGEHERLHTIAGAGINATSNRPEPYLETRTLYSVTTSNALTMPPPASMVYPTGIEIKVAVENATAGALGALTFDAAYGAVTYTSPPAGGVSEVRFRYNGTSWVQVK